MSAKFDYAEAERDSAELLAAQEAYGASLLDSRPDRDFAGETRRLGSATRLAARRLPMALEEIRRLLGVVHEVHNNGAWKTLQCACPDCAAWRATTKETT